MEISSHEYFYRGLMVMRWRFFILISSIVRLKVQKLRFFVRIFVVDQLDSISNLVHFTLSQTPT